MIINSFSEKLAKHGLPLFWQYFMLVHISLIVFVTFLSDPLLIHSFNFVLKTLTSIAVIAGYIHHKQAAYPWMFLVAAVVAIGVSVNLKSLIFFGMALDPAIPFWIEQVGILFIAVFGFNILLLVENRNNLRGFTIDFILLILSGFVFLFLISPNFLHVLIYEMSMYQELSLIHLVVAIGTIILVILNFILIPSVKFKDIILVLLVLFVSLHFLVEALFTFNLLEKESIYGYLSEGFYHLAGSFSIIMIFVEKLKLDFVSQYTRKTGVFFSWGATIIALMVIPVGVIYRWSQGVEPLNPIFLAVCGLVLVLIVITRFTILINNSNAYKKKLMTVALNDQLTSASNYLGFHEKYSIIAKYNPTIIVINIEDFQSINHLYGREFGDEVLKSLVKRLESQPDIKIVARMGADTFLIYLQIPRNEVEKKTIDLHEELGVWDLIKGERIAVPLTFGVSHSEMTIEAEVLIKQAETAFHIARQKRINHYLYNTTHDLEKSSLHRNELRGILQKAVDYNYLPVHFQPIYNIDDGSLKAIELLIRVQSEKHGLLLPGQFLKQAQSYGLLTSLTRVCLRMIAKNLDKLPNVTININIPSYILDDKKILDELILGFQELNLPPKRFCIEVMEDEDIPAEHLLHAVNRLKEEGFSIAMDDFGTGYSSLSRLSLLPFDTIKIDRSVLLAASTGNRAILESTITLIKRLGITAVVEGVETIEQLNLVRLLGADSVQGYLFSKPISLDKTSSLPLNAANIIEEF